MKCVAFVLLLAILSGCQSRAQRPKPLPARQLTQLEREFARASYTIVGHEAEIPPAVRSLVTPRPNPIANPGEEYNETDFIDSRKPMHQLVFAGISPNSAFVLYRTGSLVGPLLVLLITRTERNEVTAYCTLVDGAAKVTDLKELQDLVSHGLQLRGGYGCD